jgi:hypothetical protein
MIVRADWDRLQRHIDELQQITMRGAEKLIEPDRARSERSHVELLVPIEVCERRTRLR